MVTRPQPNLNEGAMPWARDFDEWRQRTEDRIERFVSDDSGDALASRIAADNISGRLAELEKVIGINAYTIPPFSVPYAGVGIGQPPIVVYSPTWNLNIPTGIQRISAIVNVNVSDSAGEFGGPRRGRMLFSVGSDSAISQGEHSFSNQVPLPRSLMLTVQAQQPLSVSVGFMSTDVVGGTLTGRGTITLVFYGK